MEFNFVIRSLSCKFAVLVTSGLKIIPRCSECMIHSPPEEYKHEGNRISHLNGNIKSENNANEEEENMETTDDEDSLDTFDDRVQKKEEVKIFDKLILKPTQLVEIKSEFNEATQTSTTEDEENLIDCKRLSNTLSSSNDVSNRLQYLNNITMSIYQSKSKNQNLPLSHLGKTKSSPKCQTFTIIENFNVKDVSNKLPSSVTVTKVPKEGVDNIHPAKLLGSRKNRDVIVTTSGNIRENIKCDSIPSITISSSFGMQDNLRAVKFRTERHKFRRSVGRKHSSRERLVVSRMSKKTLSYVKISETCKLCLHHFTVKQAFDRDQKVNNIFLKLGS